MRGETGIANREPAQTAPWMVFVLAVVLAACGGGGGTTSIPIGNPVPQVSSLSPSSTTVGGAGFNLTVNGSGFINGSIVRWNGSDRPTTFISNIQLTAAIPASDIAAPGSAQVTVFNPSPGGGVSAATTFTINPPPVLTVTTTSLPATTGGKSYDFTLATIGGTLPITWTITSGSLPGSLTLDAATGQISGTVDPASNQTFNFTIQATDSSATPQTDDQLLSILVRATGTGRNDICPTNAPQISNGTIRASISPYGEIDVYSFQGTAGAQVTIEIFSQRLELDADPLTRDSFLDSVVELLNSSCVLVSPTSFNDDIDPGIIQDSLLNFSLPTSGTFYIRVRDFRGDGRPDFIYDLRLTGAN